MGHHITAEDFCMRCCLVLDQMKDYQIWFAVSPTVAALIQKRQLVRSPLEVIFSEQGLVSAQLDKDICNMHI